MIKIEYKNMICAYVEILEFARKLLQVRLDVMEVDQIEFNKGTKSIRR